MIATGSADTTIKLWDVQRPEKAVTHFTFHSDKVQQVLWNAKQPSVILSGGYDKKAFCFDTREKPNATSSSLLTFNLTADVECMQWDPFSSERFLVSTEDGLVRYHDIRADPSVPIFTINAHDAAVSALNLSAKIPGLLVTGSSDKMVKVWNIKNNTPTCLISRDVEVVIIFQY